MQKFNCDLTFSFGNLFKQINRLMKMRNKFNSQFIDLIFFKQKYNINFLPMSKRTFDTYKSVNNRLHNKLAQTDEYQKFLKRIQSIVDRKNKIDRSSEFYMTFLNKSRQKSNKQKFFDKEYVLQLENKHLLQKIQKEKNRKALQASTIHELHWKDKRMRQQEKINQENGKMAQRIMQQNSYLVNKGILSIDLGRSETEKSRITKLREDEMKFFESRINNRKLPKLVRSPQNSSKTIEIASQSVHNPSIFR